MIGVRRIDTASCHNHQQHVAMLRLFNARLLIAIAIIGWAIPASAYDCQNFQPAKITVTPIYSPVRYDNNESLPTIGRLANEVMRSPSGDKEIPVGLTASSLLLKSAFTVSTDGMTNDPMVCAQITSFDFEFGFNDTTVYVARELPINSCGYQEVLTHENRHVNADRVLMQFYLPRLEKVLADGVRAAGVIRASSARIAEDKLRRVMDEYITRLGERLTVERRRQQQAIDTPEEYRRIGEVCNYQVSRIVSKTASNR